MASHVAAHPIVDAKMGPDSAAWRRAGNDTSLVSVISGGVCFLPVLFRCRVVVVLADATFLKTLHGGTGSMATNVGSGRNCRNDCGLEYDFHDLCLFMHGLDSFLAL